MCILLPSDHYSHSSIQALDALLKDVCSALLESDVNVKLVSSLRSKVRAKVKPILEGNADKAKEANRRQLIQKAISYQ